MSTTGEATRKRLVPRHLFGDYPAQLRHFTRATDGCWEFTGYIAPNGYGQLGRNIPAHRVAWEVANGGPIPDGLHIDHQCHNRDPECRDWDTCVHRRCVNPAHLEAVPQGLNVLRGKGFAPLNASITHCPAGHEYTDANTYRPPGRPNRQCRTCRYEANRRHYEQHHAQVTAQRAAIRQQRTFAIREWAMANGLPCKMSGPISRQVRTAYAQAHEGAAA